MTDSWRCLLKRSDEKICERAQKWWLLNKERAAENKRQWRMRVRLGLQEKRKLVSPEERRQKARERAARWRLVNKEREAETKKRARLAHPEEHKERKRQSYLRHRDDTLKRRKGRRDLNPEPARQKGREWYAANKSRRQTDEAKKRACEAVKRWYGRHREEIRERQRANPEKKQAWVRKRRAAKAGAEGSFTPEDIQRIYALQDGKCNGCGIEFKTTGTHRYHIDHIIPLQPRDGGKPGSNRPENLQLLCRTCNRQKSNLSPEEWRRRYKTR